MRIDLNADVGEGFGPWALGDDEAMLRVVTSANVACGFSAGDAPTMRRVCDLAVASGVRIGAQVGYQDLPGFGRRFLDVEPDALTQEVVYQIGALQAFAAVAGDRVRYVKPHGALYNAIVSHEQQAAAVVRGVVELDRSLAVVGLPGSVFLRLAEAAGLRVVREGFADRAYTPEGTLVLRTQPGAVLSDPERIAERCVAMATGRPVVDAAGGELVVDAESLCVHGDTAGAVVIALAVRDALRAAGVDVLPVD